MFKKITKSLTMTQSAYELIDIGANLAHPSFKHDLKDVLQRSKQAGLVKIIITGTCEKSTKEAFELAKQHPKFLYFTAGLHPHDAKDFNANTISTFRKYILENPQLCVAVGECGLDYNRNFSPQNQQRSAFESQVQLAVELQKPLFIHERDAHEDMVKILTKYLDKLPPTVIHCFTGKAKDAQKYVGMGLNIGLTGFLWKDKTEDGVLYALKNKLIPLERLVLETDAPYMYPKLDGKKIPKEIFEKISEYSLSFHKFCSFKRNEPCVLASVCELIAAYSGVSAQELATITTQNAKKIYKLD